MASVPCQTYPEKRYELGHQYNTHCEAGCVLQPFVCSNSYQSLTLTHTRTHTHTHIMISVILKDRHDVKVESHKIERLWTSRESGYTCVLV
jgi:hypothetical protein